MMGQPQLFNNPNGPRGGTELRGVTFAKVYGIIRERLEYLQEDYDPDAVCQQACVEIEKAMGIFPNIGNDKPLVIVDVKLERLLQAVGDAIANVIDRMLKGSWTDDHGHPVHLNITMTRLAEVLGEMTQYRTNHLGYTSPTGRMPTDPNQQGVPMRTDEVAKLKSSLGIKK